MAHLRRHRHASQFCQHFQALVYTPSINYQIVLSPTFRIHGRVILQQQTVSGPRDALSVLNDCWNHITKSVKGREGQQSANQRQLCLSFPCPLFVMMSAHCPSSWFIFPAISMSQLPWWPLRLPRAIASGVYVYQPPAAENALHMPSWITEAEAAALCPIVPTGPEEPASLPRVQLSRHSITYHHDSWHAYDSCTCFTRMLESPTTIHYISKMIGVPTLH